MRARSPRLYLLAPVVVVLWANLHGSFVLGPALLGYAWLSDVAAKRPARVSLWILVAGTLATLVNPYLAGAWLYAANIGVNPAIAGQVSEWQRTSPFAMPGLLFYPSVVVTVVLMLRRRDLVRWPDWVLVAAMALDGRVGGPGRRVVGARDGLPARGRARERAPGARRRARAP